MGFPWVHRRRSVGAPVPAGITETPAADPAQVLELQRATRWLIFRQCVIAAVFPVFVVGVLRYGSFVLDVNRRGEPSSPPVDFAEIDLTVSGTTAAAALAILGGVIVALQVAARPSPSIVDGDHEQIIARVTILEDLAMVSGLTAGGLGVLTAWHVGLDQIAHRPLYVLGPVLLGALLCAVASDAGTASKAKYGRVISDEIARQGRNRAQTALDALTTQARVSGRRDTLLQGTLATALSLSFAGIAMQSTPGGRSAWALGAGIALITLIGFILMSGAWSQAELLFRTRRWTDGGFLWLLGALTGLLVPLSSMQIIFGRLDDSDETTVVRGTVLGLFQLLALVLVAVGVGRVDHPWIRGRGRTYILGALAKAAREPQDTGRPTRSPRGRSVLLLAKVSGLLIGALIPPIGIPIAVRCRRAGTRPALRRTAALSLVLSTLVCLILVGVATFGMP